MDEELNRLIDAALDEACGVKPAPDFLPRLRAHVEAQPRRAPVRWAIPIAASAVTVVAGFVVGALLRDRPPAVIAVPSRAAQPLIVRAETPATVSVDRPPSTPPRRVARLPRRVEAPTVMVPSGQRAALMRFAAALDAGDEHATAAVRRLGTVPDITIAPIQIDPVIVPAIKEVSWQQQ